MKKDEIVGKTVFEIAPHNLALIYYQKDKELFDRPGTQLYESQVRYADGSLHDVIFEKATLINENGDAEGLTGVILDITERKRVEDELRNTNRLLEGILDGIPDIIGIQNQITRLLDITRPDTKSWTYS
jgi:PAS domain-containing protein